MYQNYIFDLYGTLVDIATDEESRRFWEGMAFYFNLKGARYRADELKSLYQTAFSEQSQERQALLIRERTDAVAEVDFQPIFQRMYAKYHISVSDAEIADTALAFRASSLKHIRLYPGAAALLKKIRATGRKAYLLSNAQSLFTSPELAMLGLTPHFDGILLSSDAGIKKPDPMFYQTLMERFQLDPARSVMIGNDDTADCHGAAGAGIDSIYLHTRQSPKKRRSLPKNCRQMKSLREIGRIVL